VKEIRREDLYQLIVKTEYFKNIIIQANKKDWAIYSNLKISHIALKNN
jgi:hypothetical protein